MMLLTVDVGNSETTIGVWDRGNLRRTWRLSTRPTRTADEYAMYFRGLMATEDLSFDRNVTGVAIASVVPAVTASLREMVVAYFPFEPLVVETGIRTGVEIRVDNPREVGSDRIANVVAAVEKYGGPAVLVDMGTATTFDIIDGDGAYLGGAIAPGLEMWSEVLVRGTAQLKRVPLEWPKRLIGRSTTEALQAGIVVGYASFVDGMISRYLAEMGDGTTVVLAGGQAGVFAPNLHNIDHVDVTLTLEGLRILFDRNT